MVSRIEVFSILQHRAQPADRLVSANTRPPIACVDDATPQVYQSRRPEITVVYQLPKPLPNDQTQLHLKPEALLDRLAMLLPQPREHRHSYHDEQGKAKDTDGQKGFGGFKGGVSCRAMLLARIYDVFPLVFPQFYTSVSLIAPK
jgi:hypothetical protein